MAKLRRRAFTLIELLVVIAIIAILAAILFPVFAQAKTAAKAATCLSNQKQLVAAILMYAGDHDDTPPLGFVPADRNATGLFDPVNGTASWHNLIQPYEKNWGLNICPDYPPFLKGSPDYKDPFIAYGMPPTARVTQNRDYFRDSYYQGRRMKWQGLIGAFKDNRWTHGGGSRGENAPSSNLSTVADAASMTLVTDSTSPDWWLLYTAGDNRIADNTFAYYIQRWYQEYGSQTIGPLGRHRMKRRNYISYKDDVGQIIVGFVDGHAKTMEFMQYLRPRRIADGTDVYANLWPYGD